LNAHRHDLPLLKKELVQHFKGRYASTTVYRELKNLVESGKVIAVGNAVSVPKS